MGTRQSTSLSPSVTKSIWLALITSIFMIPIDNLSFAKRGPRGPPKPDSMVVRKKKGPLVRNDEYMKVKRCFSSGSNRNRKKEVNTYEVENYVGLFSSNCLGSQSVIFRRSKLRGEKNGNQGCPKPGRRSG